MTTSVVKARVDNTVKVQSEAIFRHLGMDMTSAIKVFLAQVVMQGGLPFELKVAQPNERTLAAIADSYAGNMHDAASVDALFAEAGN